VDEPVTTAAAAAEAEAQQAVVAASPSRWSWPLRLIGVGFVVALLGLLAWATLRTALGKSIPARVAAGETPPAPAFSLAVLWPRAETWPAPARRALEDGRVDLSELRGRPLVINFWASWCIPCRDEAPLLNASARAHAGEVVFLGIDVQDLREDALAFSREFETPYVSVRARGNGTYNAYGLTGVPETFYVDARGRIVAHAPGPVSRDSLEAGIAVAEGGGT
jgi:cytochrome c biogenesis protein CcmG/thiol:disulfide interchange protein DsbE